MTEGHPCPITQSPISILFFLLFSHILLYTFFILFPFLKSMVPCTVTAPSSSSLVAAAIIHRHASFSRCPPRNHSPINSISIFSTSNASRLFNRQGLRQAQAQAQLQPRTLFPGGFKRPELKVPTLVLQLDADEVLTGGDGALDLIDRAVSKWVGIVVLSSNEASGGRLYEAACLLKSLVRDRAFLLVAERVDIAAAAATSGVLLSDQGIFSMFYLLSISS